ncbi:MAG TPA: hypothetical protein VFC21_11850 [Bryobacteraceae bacterium]|nr:hypothetical protein [Bryobacteraceae bacterium]
MGACSARGSWNEKRRPALLAIFEDQVYGGTPSQEIPQRTDRVGINRKALGGKAIREQVTIYFSDRDDGPQLLIYQPAKRPGATPLFAGLNFNGNQAVGTDPGILTNDVWLKDSGGQEYVQQANFSVMP